VCEPPTKKRAIDSTDIAEAVAETVVTQSPKQPKGKKKGTSLLLFLYIFMIRN